MLLPSTLNSSMLTQLLSDSGTHVNRLYLSNTRIHIPRPIHLYYNITASTLTNQLHTICIIISLHHSTTYVDAAYCYGQGGGLAQLQCVGLDQQRYSTPGPAMYG